MSATLEALSQNLQKHLGDRVKSLKVALGEVTIEVDAADYLTVMQTLHDEPELCFEELIDLCGVDYSTYGNVQREGPAFRCGQSPFVDQQELAAARSLLCAR
jgi:NADH-quinone oxidoreductase subunit C